MRMEKHFVIFCSPGTLMLETSTKPIGSWDVEKAVKMVSGIIERYGATPYGFKFSTRAREHNELDSKEIKDSHMYFLGGKVLTLADVKARKDPNDKILIWNMETNDFDRIIENTNSYKVVLPLKKDDVVLDYTPPKRKEEKG